MTFAAEHPPSDDDREPEALAPVPSCRLCVAYIGGAGPATFVPIVDVVVGPSLAGVPVLASDGSTLVVIGHLPDESTHVWSGAPSELVHRVELPRRLHLVSLVHHRGSWHLFGALDASRPYHAVSQDLVDWHHDRAFANEHPHLRITGAAATSAGIVVLGQVMAKGQPIGWTQLVEEPVDGSIETNADDVLIEALDVEGHRRGRPHDRAGRYRAREITLPLTPEHIVVGPAAVHDDEIALALTSGSTQMLARTAPGSRGRSWTLGLMSPELQASVVFARGRDVWLAGIDPAGGAPMVAVSGDRGFHLDRSGGPVCAAVVHGDELVMARLPVADDRTGDDEKTAAATTGAMAPMVGSAGVAQSSPAYIDSISAA